MTIDIDHHSPRPAFRDALESRIGEALRTDPAPARSHVGMPAHWLRRAAIVLVTLGIGAAAGAGSAQVRDSAERQRLMQAERAELAVAQKRVELAREAAAQARERWRTGLAGEEEADAARAELAAMESSLRRIELDMAEIEATGRAPRDDLAAPTVGERDFVRERLELQLRAAQERLQAAEQVAREAEERHRVGIADVTQHLEAIAEEARARAAFEIPAGEVELREQALARRIGEETVALRRNRLELATQLRLSERLRELAARQLEEARERARVRQIDEVQLLRIELQLAERSAAIERLRSQIEALQPGGI